MSLTLDLPEPLNRELSDEAAKEGVSPSDHAALLLCIIAAFHDLGKAETPFQQVVKAISESHSVAPHRLAALVNDLVEYCQAPAGHGKMEAALSSLASQTTTVQPQEHDLLLILPYWRQGIVHAPLDVSVKKWTGTAKPVEYLQQSHGRIARRLSQEPEQIDEVDKPQWPAGFFEQTYGSLQDTPLERLPQEDYEKRDEIE